MASPPANPAPGTHTPRWLVGVALLTVAACMPLRFASLAESIWFDEAIRTQVVLGSHLAIPYIFADVHGPLYNLFMLTWINLFGDSELSIRLPSLLASLATVAMVWWWGRARIEPGAANLAALWLLVAPAMVWYGTMAKNNAFTMAMTTAAVVALETALRQPSWRRGGWAVALVVLALATDFQALMVLVPTYALMRREAAGLRGTPLGIEQRGILRGALIGAIAFCVPWILLKLTHLAKLHRHHLSDFTPDRVGDLLAWYWPTGRALELPDAWIGPVYAAVAAVVATLLLTGVLRLWRSEAGRIVIAGCLFPPLAMFGLSMLLRAAGSSTQVFQERNLLVMLPWYGLMLGAGVAQAVRRLGAAGWAPGAAIIALSTLCSVMVWCGDAERRTVDNPRPDWRAAGRWIVERGLQQSKLVSIGDPLALRYYVPTLERLKSGRVETFRQHVASLTAPGVGEGFVLVHQRDWDRIETAEVHWALERLEIVGHSSFRLLDVYWVRGRSATPATQPRQPPLAPADPH